MPPKPPPGALFSMTLIRVCKACGASFSAIKETHHYCCRKCFKKDYYTRTRDKIKARLIYDMAHPVYPTRICDFCGYESSLEFDPTKEEYRFDTWECPCCHVPNSLLWRYQDNFNSYQKIACAMASVQSTIIQNGTFKNVSLRSQSFITTFA